MAEQTITPINELEQVIPEPELSPVLPRWPHLAKIAGRLALSGACALVGGALALQTSPYETSLAGVSTEIHLTTTPGVTFDATSTGVTLDSSLGQWKSPNVTSLPFFGITVRPMFDSANLEAVASNTSVFVKELEADAKAAAPAAIGHFSLAGGIGLGIGAANGALLYEILPLLRKPEVRRRLYSTATIGAVGAGAIFLGVGAATYNSDWPSNYTVTGMLADAQAIPQQLQQLQSSDVLRGNSDIQALQALQHQIVVPAEKASPTNFAYNILLISDMHDRDQYKSLLKIVTDNHVAFIINTGDETETGSARELSLLPGYLDDIRALAAKAPMLWIKGNHDSAAVSAQMAAIPGVTVLDRTEVQAFGLTIGGLGDPIDYLSGQDITSQASQDKEKNYATAAAKTINPDTKFDIMASHEPTAVQAIGQVLGKNKVVALLSGHTHAQAFQAGTPMSIIVGSTGMGGLFNLAGQTPEEFSLLGVREDCSLADLTEVAIKNPNSPLGANSSIQQITINQPVTNQNRVCRPDSDISSPTSW